jgi:hypothetical protein
MLSYMRREDLLTAADEQLIAEYENNIAPNVALAVSSIQSELQRRATLKLIAATERLHEATSEVARSSRKLERFTTWLIWLTVLLLVAAAPPAIEVVHRLLE